MNSLFRLRSLVKPYIPQIFLSLLILAALTGFSLVVPRIIQQVIDEGIANGEKTFLVNAALLLLGLGLLTAVLGAFQRYISEWIGGHVGYDLRNRLYDHIQNLSFSYHDHAQTGQLISRCIEDVRSVQNFIGTSIVDLIQIVFILFGALGIMFASNWQLTLIAILPIFPLILSASAFGRRVSELFFNVDHALGVLSSRLQENVTGAQVVRAFAREAYENDRFDKINRDYYQARITVIHEWSRIMPATDFLVTLCTILLLAVGGNMVINGELSIRA